jgi:hypothetical protein
MNGQQENPLFYFGRIYVLSSGGLQLEMYVDEELPKEMPASVIVSEDLARKLQNEGTIEKLNQMLT